MSQNIPDEIILTALKLKAPLCSWGENIKICNKRQNKEDTYTTYYPKTAYWRPLVTNAEIVEDTTNIYLKNN